MQPTIAAETDPDSDEVEGDPPDEPDIAEVELTEDDFGGDDIFSDIEDADESTSRSQSDVEDVLGDLDDRGGQLEVAINDGAARLAVVGLEESDELEEEFQKVFEAFRLGFLGTRFAEEYILLGDDEAIDPAWGLLGSMLCCVAVTLWMRPDGDEQLARFQSAMSTIASGVEV